MLWKSLLADFAKTDFKPTLIHGDLSSENILFDPRTHRLTGILDWSYAQVGDPALDFSHLYLHNPALGDEVLNQGEGVGDGLRKRVQWYIRTEPFYDIMWAVTHHWRKAERMGERNLEKELP